MDVTGIIVLLCCAAIVALTVWFNARRKRIRLEAQHEAARLYRESLIVRFGSPEIADAIIAHKVWQGMTTEHLVESWGQPQDVDEAVYKAKTKQTWKYGIIGKNRYRQRVFLENNVVVGWQDQ